MSAAFERKLKWHLVSYRIPCLRNDVRVTAETCGFRCVGDGGSSRSSSQEIENDETSHTPPSSLSAAAVAAAQSGGGGGGVAPAAAAAHESLAPLRRRRASMQDALDFTKINASLYERPVGI